MESAPASSQCPDCEASVDAGDNYCRNCGMFVAVERQLPAERPSDRAVQTRSAGLPVPVKRAATAVAVGAALQVGASLAGKYLLRQAVQSLKPSPGGKNDKKAETKDRNLPAKTETLPADSPATVVSETFMIRRVWMRRD